MSLIQRGEAPNYKVDELDEYIKQSLKCDVEQHPNWQMTYGLYINRKLCGNDHSPTPPLTFDRKVEAKDLEREASRVGE